MGWNDHAPTKSTPHSDEKADAGLPGGLREVVEDLVVVTQWHKGFAQCECPLGHTDARVYVDRGYPFMHCLHEKCRDEVNEINIALREATAWMEDTPRRIKLTPAERAIAERKSQLRRLEVRTREYLLPRLRQHPVPLEEWIVSSPYPVRDRAIEEHWQLFLQGLYELSDLIWIGRLHESGAEHKNCFRRVGSWLDRFGALGAPDPFVSVAGFDSTKLRRDWSRSRRNVSKRLYVVLESDTESQEAFGATVKYACKYMRLRALTDTGGKSLHAMFESFAVRRAVFPPRPEPEFYIKVPFDDGGYWVDQQTNPNYKTELEAWEARFGKAWRAYWRQQQTLSERRQDLYAILRGLSCDPQMLDSGLTTRLPGHPRLDDDGTETGRWQRLLYLDPCYETTL